MNLYIDKGLIETYTREQRQRTIRNVLSFLEDNKRVMYKIQIDGEIHKFPNAISDKVYDDFVKDVKFTTIDTSEYLDLLLQQCVVKLEDFYEELDDILNNLRSYEDNYVPEFVNSFLLFTEDLKGVCDSIYKNLGVESLFRGKEFNALLENLRLIYDRGNADELSETLFFEFDPLFDDWIKEAKKLYAINKDILINNDDGIYLSSLNKFINDLNIVDPNVYGEGAYHYTSETIVSSESSNLKEEIEEEIAVEELEEEEIEEEIAVEELEEEEVEEEIVVEELEEEEIEEEIAVEELEEEEIEEEVVVEELEEEVEEEIDDTSGCSTLYIFDKLYSIYEKKR